MWEGKNKIIICVASVYCKECDEDVFFTYIVGFVLFKNSPLTFSGARRRSRYCLREAATLFSSAIVTDESGCESMQKKCIEEAQCARVPKIAHSE